MAHVATLEYCPTPEVVVATFGNGIPRANNNMKISYHGHTNKDDPRSVNKRILVAETDRLQYVGQNFGDTTQQQSSVKYLVGMFNKETGKMKIYDAQMIHMRPYLHEAATESDDEVDANYKDTTYTEKNDMLTKAFGSTKKRRAMNSRLRNKVEEDTLQSALGSAVSEVNVAPSDIIPATETSSVIPPYNKDATSPRDVYNIDDIITPPEMENLQTVAKIFTDYSSKDMADWLAKSAYPKYVLQHLNILPVRHEARLTKSCLLMYLNFMIVLYKLKAKEMGRKNPLPDEVPDLVTKSMLDKYTLCTKSSKNNRVIRCMPSRLKDKLLSNILVLCLMIDEFHLELTDIQFGLKIGQEKIINHSRSLGCKVSRSKDSSSAPKTITAELIVPLVFPEVMVRQKKGRR